MKNEELIRLKKEYTRLLERMNEIKESIDKFNLLKNDADIQKYFTLKNEIKTLMFEMAAKKIDIYSELDTRLDYYRKDRLDELHIELVNLLTKKEVAEKIRKYNDMSTYLKNNKILDDDSIIREIVNNAIVTSDEDKYMVVGFSTDVDGKTNWKLKDIESGKVTEVDDSLLVTMTLLNIVIILGDNITLDKKDNYENIRYQYFSEAIKNSQESANEMLLNLQRKQKEKK